MEEGKRKLQIYTVTIKTRGGKKRILIGTFNDCVAFVHEMGHNVRKAKIRAVE